MNPEWPFYVYILFTVCDGIPRVFYVGGAWSLKTWNRINAHSATRGAKHAQKFIREHPDVEIHREVYAYCADKVTVDLLEPTVWDEFARQGHPVQPERPGQLSLRAQQKGWESHKSTETLQKHAAATKSRWISNRDTFMSHWTPEYRVHHGKKMEEAQACPEVKAVHSTLQTRTRIKEAHARPDVKIRHRNSVKMAMSRPDRVVRRLYIDSLPETQFNRSQAQRNNWLRRRAAGTDKWGKNL